MIVALTDTITSNSGYKLLANIWKIYQLLLQLHWLCS